jgi:preprotein translocase subunit SecA
VEAHAKSCSQLNDHDLSLQLLQHRDIFRRNRKETTDTLPTALAAIREMARRKLGLHAYPVQVMGTLALHHGYLAEMQTGEGKTLTAGLAAVLAGWTGRPCHIITVNDYLVERDANWLAPLYRACGVREGFVTAGMSPEQRRNAYARDVTYTTSKELLADFLRDRLRLPSPTQPERRLVQQLRQLKTKPNDGLILRGLHTAIVDEADSVLIDEAVTPLIISSPRPNELLREACLTATNLITSWQRNVHYTVNPRYREIELTPEGSSKLQESCAGFQGLWQAPARRLELIRQALVAREFYQEGKQYLLQNNKVVIVDEFTGRPMPQRTWQQGLHQTIEAQAGVPLTDPSETIGRLSFQRFFRCFHRLSGMTGTASESTREFWHVYRLPVIRIPTHRPCIRQLLPDRAFTTEDQKWAALVAEIQRIHATGRPILVGTRSVAASEHLATLLSRQGLAFSLLNATRLAEEAGIIAGAGEKGQITIATNMAGRGTDIKLGPGVHDLGGLHVIATERHESRRVDRQLLGRAGRQGDPGSGQIFLSLEDDLLRKHLPNRYRKMLPASASLISQAMNLAQRRAQKLAAKQRRKVLQTDTWLEDSLAFAGLDLIS